MNQLLDFRCDKATYVGTALGCVFHEFQPELVFDATDGSDHQEAALHMQDALYAPERVVPHTGVRMPGRADLDEPLRRNFHGNRSRTIVQQKCEELWPGYASQGLECDEYPFSSTYQNPNYTEYSVRAITAAHNSRAGVILGSFFQNQRLTRHPWPPPLASHYPPRQPGQHRTVAYRRGCNKQLRAALVRWAQGTPRAKAWACDTYDRARARGCRRPHAAPILAHALTRIRWRRWHDHVPCNPDRRDRLINLIQQAA